MHGLNICVAGIEKESRQHLRPVTGAGDDRMNRKLLSDQGGPFELGAVVDLGPVEAYPRPPAVEDHRFDPGLAHRIRRLDADEYLALLDEVSCRNLRGAFGPELKRRGQRKYATDLGKGDRTLACVRLQSPLMLEINPFGRLELRFESAGRTAYAPVNDLRFYEDDQVAFRHEVIEDVSNRLRSGVDTWVMFGLTRPWKTSDDDLEKHWLQVNGLCLEDRPLGPQP